YLGAGRNDHIESLKYMLSGRALRENVDGEALDWAAKRLRAVAASRRLLVVISDGVPSDDSTNAQIAPEFLQAHLRQIITEIIDVGDIHLKAFGIGNEQNVEDFYPDATVVGDGKRLPEQVVGACLDWLRGVPSAHAP